MRAAGWGRLFGLWLVYPPVLAGYADGWPGRTTRLTERFHESYAAGRIEGYDWMEARARTAAGSAHRRVVGTGERSAGGRHAHPQGGSEGVVTSRPARCQARRAPRFKRSLQ
ncbi:hypothetical protein Agsp01_00190 [Agromyces sp. NBRC 114283]|nr:hypothetical protein Agsp01_00190 [Agromyces sp. NBRC 114283]